MPEPQQRNQLAARYREMEDPELLHLARTRDDLTGIAQQALDAELERRRLALPPAPPADKSHRPAVPGFQSPLIDFVDLAREASAIEFVEIPDALEASESLTLAGIEHILMIPRLQSLDIWAPRLIVAPDDHRSARTVLDQYNAKAPLLSVGEEEEVGTGEEDGAAEFQAPPCPECGVADPLLEAANPTNLWRCEACGARWKDSIPG